MMKKLLWVSICVLLVGFLSAQDKVITGKYGELIVEEFAPVDFLDYDGTLLIAPAFKAIGTTNFFSKRMDKLYTKPYHVAEYEEVLPVFDEEKYDIEEYRYMIMAQKLSMGTDNASYSFYLYDRETSIMYQAPRSPNMFKKYMSKVLEPR